ncbi:MAG TPA: thioesterase family protein [Bacteroidota bacterium]|nr:thioesterase family protein [Bacteroidota bacterium]
MIFSDTEIRVRYADTDQMKFAYYGKFFEYFEQGRSDLLRQIGMPYPELEQMGYYLPVIEAHARYRKSARYDDLLIVRTVLRDPPQVRVRIEYEVRLRDGEVLAEGYTVHSFLNAENGRPTRAPEEFLRSVAEKMAGTGPIKR